MSAKRLAIVLAVSLGCALSLSAQKGPNLELGFQPQKLYQFTDLDSVNLFNGNLSVSVPIGPEYRVGGALKYQLALVYNSKVWDYEQLVGQGGEQYELSRPNLRSNAGLGWRLSLGQLLPKSDSTNTYPAEARGSWVYEGPAGDEQSFSDVVAGEGSPVDPYNAQVLFSGNGLRMIKMADGGRTVEMPSGERHIFRDEDGRWRLKEINDRFGNWMRIAYVVSGGADQSWTITDSANRTQTVQFFPQVALADTIYKGQVVSSVTLEGINGTDSTYTFGYSNVLVELGCGHRALDNTETTATLPFLTQVSFPDNTSFHFDYHRTGVTSYCEQGALSQMQLPTGGTVNYQYQQYNLPTTCAEASWADQPIGIRARTTPDGTWNYIQDIGPTYSSNPPMAPNQPGPCGMTEAGEPLGRQLPRRWSRTVVLAPVESGLRKRTDHFFALTNRLTEDPFLANRQWLLNPGPLTGYPGVSGAPARSAGNVALTPAGEATTSDVISVDEPNSADGRFLSTRVFEGCPPSGAGAGCVPIRETYLRYDQEVFGPRVRTSATLSPSDLSCGAEGCVSRSLSTDSDGAGHYRSTTTSSNVPNSPSSTDFKQYPQWTTTTRRDSTVPWVHGIFTESRRTVGASTVVSQYCFDGSTGFLTQRRTLRNQVRDAADIIEAFAATSKGEIASEKSYGGDSQAVPTSSHCSNVGSLTPQYWIENTYVGGVLATSRYRKSATEHMGFYRADRDIDSFTGLVTVSRDSAQRATTYAYDADTLRLQSVTPPDGAVTSITYTDATSVTGAYVDVSASDTAQRYAYDGLGRLVRESFLSPNGKFVTTETTYDALGRRKSFSVPTEGSTTAPTAPINATKKTTFTYDALDRQLTVTAPDGSITSTSYPSIWKRERSSWVRTPVGVEDSRVKEEYDSLGRLLRVAERSGPAATAGALPPAAEVVTTYSYDAADRLTSVFMSDPTSGKSQTRTFEYDGRGFLIREVPVESSPINYAKFDAKGHASEKSFGSSLFDLKYEFDAAERLTKVWGRNPESTGSDDAFRLMKEFTYCTASTTSNLCQGKLATATRYNYRVSPAQPFETQARGTLLVTEDYEYGDLAGRLTSRKTTISSISPFTGLPVPLREISQSLSYNELGLPGTIKYPMCADCGLPPGIPDRQLQPNYTSGRTTSLPGFATGLTYAPSGQLTSLTHPAGPLVDAYTPDTNGLARPKSITFGRPDPTATTGGFYAECVPPSIQTHPVSQTVASGQSATLTVTVTATSSTPLSYQWYSYNVSNGATNAIAGATNSSFTVSPTATTGYFVRASNACRFVDSNLATLTVSGSCKAPSISSLSDGRTSNATSPMAITVVSGTSLNLSVIAAGSDPLTYQWSRVTPSAQTLGTTAAIPVSITSSSQYKVVVSNSCGSVTATFNITVPLPAPALLTATRTATDAITVSWQAVAGAASYRVQRRSNATGFENLSPPATSTQFVDSARPAGSTFVYRVVALDSAGGSMSPPSNFDVATTLNFTPAAPGSLLSAQRMTELLASVNALRSVAGWAAVSWPQILPAGVPEPSAGSLLFGSQLAALRNEFNQLLSALGVSSPGFTDPQLSNAPLRAIHITELQQRGQ